ncbi:phosphate signaling complex protein PhoU [Anoxybacillus flavithermus]|uniref:phosphate signaling complex protein PhoU n=1 Tax=Anoxybacillus flavithermus TaxID=33934 RepID=UPI000AE2D274|nr:phosphate signaling complex protein PhoU [Anoxybacillus flavithermus]MBE2939398.1 phosphate signaling complex protein PhoU [Anoxybacillus flavithermus]MBE2942037.1 phosphate signaling complex protein PhoU [Anoxybacillus flavithermus]MBE2950275.1 phosphate signaling complex protein PhoU [Anoxybacillus flavithermus]MBE2952928.1 phosphate signaling complex protein PhoU [Anoxybacillus flavithermus]MBE2958281.1 phosphate signaling complex protein PhoU [Anoxybacillus flavithermus]
MAVREKFDYDLQTLRDQLLQLGSLAEIALTQSFEALKTKNSDLALQVLENDTKIDLLNEEINDFAILLIAKQQPVAIDLRRIIVAIKIATDVERMADFAVNIAKSAIRIGEQPFVISLNKLEKMHEIAVNMLSLTLKAYYEEDVVTAKKVADMDDEVDRLYGETIRELLERTKAHPDAMSQITQLSFTARYIERIADHATNIAENVFYLVKGKHYDLND